MRFASETVTVTQTVADDPYEITLTPLHSLSTDYQVFQVKSKQTLAAPDWVSASETTYPNAEQTLLLRAVDVADATLWYGDSGVDLEAADLSAEKLEQRIELLPGVSRVSVLSTGTAAEWKITLLAADTDDQRDYRPFRLVTANGGGITGASNSGRPASRPPDGDGRGGDLSGGGLAGIGRTPVRNRC